MLPPQSSARISVNDKQRQKRKVSVKTAAVIIVSGDNCSNCCLNWNHLMSRRLIKNKVGLK